MRITCDERFVATLIQNKVEHEMYVYPGITHRETPMHETVLQREKAWYTKHWILGGEQRGSPVRIEREPSQARD